MSTLSRASGLARAWLGDKKLPWGVVKFPNGRYSLHMGTYGTDIQAALAAQIKAEMGALGWKQSDLAKVTDMQASTLHRYLSGARDIPMPVFAEIANALGLSMVELAQRAQRRLDGEDVR